MQGGRKRPFNGAFAIEKAAGAGASGRFFFKTFGFSAVFGTVPHERMEPFNGQNEQAEQV